MNEPLSPPIEPPSITNPTAPSAEDTRRDHIKHEAAVKSISILYYMGAFGIFLMGIATVLPSEEVVLPERIGVATFFACLGVFQLFVGIGLRGLKSWTRIPTGILSGLGLLAIPIGTLVNGYILYLVFSKKGATVFTDEYRQVIEATPDIKYKTSIVIWILLGLLVLLFGVVILAALFSN